MKVLGSLVALVLLSGCGLSAQTGSASGKVPVVAVENFWGSIAAQVGGEHAAVTSIIANPDTDPHDYDPTPQDARTIAQAKYVIVNGVGYDAWAAKLLDANPAPARIVLTVGDLVGKKVLDLAEERGCTALDAMLDISLEDDLRTRFWSVLANDDPDGIAWLLPRDHVLLGLADSGAHVSQLCDACFATDLLGNWVRDRGVMPLERAIHKLTAEPAGVYGLADRGLLQPGKAADICVFDPATVAPGPLRRIRDFPADGERLTADSPVGVSHVLVNGTPIRVDGESAKDGLDARPGRVLR